MVKFKGRVVEVKQSGVPLALAGSEFASRAVSGLGHKAELVPPPPNFVTAELWAAHKLLGMPCSLDVNCLYNLDWFNGVKLVRVSNYMRSCMLRSFVKTVHGIVAMQDEL